MRPEFAAWLRGLTMPELTAAILLGMEEIERRGVSTSGVVWTGRQWAVVTEDSGGPDGDLGPAGLMAPQPELVELVNAALRLAAVVGTKNGFGFILTEYQRRAVERTIAAVRPFGSSLRLEAEDVEAALAVGRLEALLKAAPEAEE